MSCTRSEEDLAQEVRQAAERAGLAAVGFASAAPMHDVRQVLEERKAAGFSGGMQFTYRNPERSTSAARVLQGARSLVVGAWPYGPAATHTGPGPGEAGGPSTPGHGGPAVPLRPQGRVARYATCDYYAQLGAALGEVAAALVARGWKARVVADDNALVDRAAAQRAGLGWSGRNCNILLPGRGSWFVLGSVVTDALLPPSPAAQPGCGSCRRCLEACPTGALVAPGVLDARRCLAWLAQAPGPVPLEYREAMGDRIYGCDDCQEVCPPNRVVLRRSPRRGGPVDHPEGERHLVPGRGGVVGPDVDLLSMLGASDEELMVTYGRWYVPERDPRYLRRNALVALGNVLHQDQASSGRAGADEAGRAEVEATLSRYLDGPDDMLREHAAWAARRAGLGHLVPCPGP